MKNNSRVEKFAIFVLAVAIIAVILVSGTFAKYTSTASGEDTVKVAKWSIKLNGTQIATASEQTITINLFDTIKDSNLTANETDVNEAGTDKLIAPGTSGNFEIAVLNDSEVNATYTETLTVTNTSNIPVEFSSDGSNWAKPNANGEVDLSVNDETLNMNTTSTKTLYWRWAYVGSSSSQYSGTQTDTTDTTLGITAREGTRPELTVTVRVTATQVD